jgi:hypothetical protein
LGCFGGESVEKRGEVSGLVENGGIMVKLRLWLAGLGCPGGWGVVRERVVGGGDLPVGGIARELRGVLTHTGPRAPVIVRAEEEEEAFGSQVP